MVCVCVCNQISDVLRCVLLGDECTSRGFVWKTRCSLKPLNICRRVWTEEHFPNKQHNFTLAKVISYSQLNESREPLVGLWKSTSGGTYTLLSFPFFTSSVSLSLKADWTLCFHYQLLIIFWLLFHFRFSEHDFAGKWFTRSASPALSIINPPLQPAELCGGDNGESPGSGFSAETASRTNRHLAGNGFLSQSRFSKL